MVQLLVHGVGDNVAVVVSDIKRGDVVKGLNMESGDEFEIESNADIPFGHKIALVDFNVDDTVIKYDNDIGRVVAEIKKGDHVHVHNVKTKRW
ncbi:MAG: UxaA family hydrolase [Deltaproteobacteria bacterium]|uniref:UxaA family hydrolase n=1 Tax=Candidatus Zymogenus saltonus TaxID=2844893 RepID=A0A9D8PNG7_9DELT|nr:UxaA family hydrolase [Candidatus Zymogenus saltonus]